MQIGPTPTDAGLRDALEAAVYGSTVSSVESRRLAKQMGEAASRGFITTEYQGGFGRCWTLTARGRDALEYLRKGS